MKTISRIKLIIGLIFIFISLVGIYPIVFSKESNFFDGESMRIDTNERKRGIDFYPGETKTLKDINDTNYPILIGIFALSGTLLLASIKNDEINTNK